MCSHHNHFLNPCISESILLILLVPSAAFRVTETSVGFNPSHLRSEPTNPSWLSAVSRLRGASARLIRFTRATWKCRTSQNKNARIMDGCLTRLKSITYHFPQLVPLYTIISQCLPLDIYLMSCIKSPT